MADITIVPQTMQGKTGITPVRNGSLSAADTYHVPNNGMTLLLFAKSGAGSCTVTVDTPAAVDGNAVANPTAVVPATTGDVILGPYPPGIYNNAAGEITFTLSDVAGLTVAVLRVPHP